MDAKPFAWECFVKVLHSVVSAFGEAGLGTSTGVGEPGGGSSCPKRSPAEPEGAECFKGDRRANEAGSEH
jgi:hypothetical protein